MQFTATIEATGKNTTGIEVPTAVVEALGDGKRPKVTVRLHDHTYRTSVASMGGRFLIPVSAEIRERAGVAAGDELEVHVELDTAPREVEVPEDLAAALAGDDAARGFFEGLSFSNKRWHVEQITGAKAEETRKRRVEKSMAMFREGRAR